MLQINYVAGKLAKIMMFMAILAAVWGLWSNPAWGALTVELVNGYNLVVDSNVTSPATYGPKSAFIGTKICNTGGTAINNVFVHAGDYIDGLTDTPGVYPKVDTDIGVWPAHLAGTGKYSLTHEANAADATRYIGTLGPGECRTEYWLISYPQCVNVSKQSQYPPCSNSITGGIKPDDDLTLNYDIWATSSIGTTVKTGKLTMRNEISASANKIWPNTTSKVPNAYLTAIESLLGWGTLGADGRPLSDSNPVYPGQRVITTQGIWYDLGNVGQGFDNDGDLIPDQNAWLQPVGDPGSFNADCFRMVGVYGILIVKLKTGGEQLIPFINQIYFKNLPDNTGVVGLVYYQFIATGEGCRANMTPYQEAASGFDNEKFSADYGLSLGLNSGSFGADLNLTKSDGLASAAPGSTLTYTISAPNNTGVNLGAPDLGVPLVFRDHIPAGATYVAGSAASALMAPSGTGSYSQGYTDADGNLDTCTFNYNVTGSGYTILYSTNNGTSWSITEPVPASSVTDIQWLLATTMALDGGHNGTDCVVPNGSYDNGALQTSLPAGKTASVQFQVTLGTNPGPIICNTARMSFGGSASGKEATDCTLVTGNNTISGFVYKDNGDPTGVFGNGIKDGTETGVGNGTNGVTVWLYYDVNGDGKVDGGDIFYGETTAHATTGAYGFANLADGRYIVVARKFDGISSPGDGIINAVNDFPTTTGWGNTTPNPNLPLTTDLGITRMTEDFTTVTLAVNIDLDNSSGPDTVSNVNFGFAPPLVITKRVQGNATSVVEGNLLDYKITIENRLPNVGRQGPTGCEYTVWASSGTTGSNPKNFVNPGNAWDATSPNRNVASALVEGGSLRWLYGTQFNMPNMGASVGITKVEGLFFSYFSVKLDDDYLALKVGTSASTVDGNGLKTGFSGATISTAQIESYIGPPADVDPNNAVAWNITSLKPGGGGWTWTDFPGVILQVSPGKIAGADGKIYYIDAVGLRVTTDCDCVASDSTTLLPVPLQDTYDMSRFTFVSADPSPTSVNTTTGVIQWDDVGPVLPGSTKTVTVTLRAKNVSGNVTGTCAEPPVACNCVTTDYPSKDVKYTDGRVTGDASSCVPANMVGKGEINGYVYHDYDNDGWPIEGEGVFPGVKVTLYACVQSGGAFELAVTSKTCAAQTSGNTWKIIATTFTDASGYYEFIGLDQATYIVEVGDTDGSPATGNITPFSGIQTGEANDTQGVDGSGNALGHDCPSCDNTWGDPTANLNTFNQINNAGTEEKISGVNFGYYMPNAAIYGNVWYDINGNVVRNAGDTGLSGFTVRLYTDPNGDGDPADGSLQATQTTGAGGNYAFSSLAAGYYVVAVTPPTLPTSAWIETAETAISPETGNLNNQIRVTLSAGQFSGSHDFGYTKQPVSAIGDTLYYDFNGNGVQDAGEAGIPDITVYLYNDIDRDGTIDAGVDGVIATTSTDHTGKYLFQYLPYGSYVVKVDTLDPEFPTGVAVTGDPDTNSASIGDLIWLDGNGNGVQDAGERGLPEVKVLLYEDTNGNGALDIGTDKVAAATSTDVNGKYLLTRLNAGYYWVSVDANTLPSSGLTLTTADPINTRITISNRKTSSVLTADAGYRSSSNYSMGGWIWSDANADPAVSGTRDPGEAGIGGVKVTVQLTSCYPNCGAKYTTTTTRSGFWMITGLADGAYTITVDRTTLPVTGFYQTNPRGGGSIKTQTISGAGVMNVDFGYIYNPDNDADYNEDKAAAPIASVSGRVFRDANGNGIYDAGEQMSGTPVNLYDDQGRLIGATTSVADGTYSFTGVFIGIYMAQATDKSGNYSTVFLAAGSNYTGLNLIYNPVRESTPDSQSAVAIDGVYDDLMQDFGYQRFTSSIGDTVYLDVNQNADQDLGEPGIPNVTVWLYLWNDTDHDGVIDSGEVGDTPLQSKITTADNPATAADESGKYLFTNLTALPAYQYYLVRVNTGTLPGTPTLVGDPDTDGVPCTDSPAPDGCDSQQGVTAFSAGMNYLGADFGYYITGSGYGSFGDMLWIDSNNNMIKDAGEPGVPYITVYIDGNGNGLLDWMDANGNGKWDAGEGERWVETDAGGYYVFTGLVDGTYNARVRTSDPDWLTDLPTTAVYEAGGAINNLITVTIVSGVVTQIDGNGCTDCNLNVDFGYRYGGTRTLSGTIGIDDGTNNGYLGATATTYSGVDAANKEVALAGLQVFFYRWTDDGDNTAWVGSALDPGDTFALIGNTSTDVNGDYSYSNLPDNIIVVFGLAASENLRLTTTNANSSVENPIKRQLYEGTSTYDGNTVTVMVLQALTLTGNTLDVDFAFDSTLGGVIAYDWGDLPNSYNGTLLTNDGAVHRVVIGSTIHLGATVSTEDDGRPGAAADGDTGDDGVTLVSSNWRVGLDGASVIVNASASGWLIGWVDFNGDGDFDDPEEQIINKAVSSGNNAISFFVPGTAEGRTDFYSRFRIYPTEPLLFSFKGTAVDSTFQAGAGEVEDYRWLNVSITFALISKFQAYGSNGSVVVEWETSAEIGTVGFFLMRLDETGENAGLVRGLVPGLLRPQGGLYRCIDMDARIGGDYTYKLIELEAKGTQQEYGPYEVRVLSNDPEGKSVPDQLLKAGFYREAHEIETSELSTADAEMAASQLPDSAEDEPAPTIMRQASAMIAPQDIEIAPIKLYTTGAALYQASASDIAAVMGGTVEEVTAMIAAGQIHMANQGIPVAYLPYADNSGLYFFGENYSTLYTDHNVYWIETGEAPPPPDNRGDINGDGKVDEADATICLDVLAGKPVPSIRADYASSGADVNSNAKIDMAELAYIYNKMSQGTSPSPVSTTIMKTVSGGSPGAAAGPQTYTASLHLEEDLWDLTDYYFDPLSDYWVWDFVSPGVYNPTDFNVLVDGAAAGNFTAQLTVHVKGLNEAPGPLDHHAEVSVNGRPVGEMQWDGLSEASQVFSFDQSILIDGANVIRVNGILNPGVDFSQFGVDGFDLTYQRTYVSANDMLLFNSSTNNLVTVSDFSGSDIMVFELLNPKSPRLVIDTLIEPDAGGYRVTFVSSGNDVNYLAVLSGTPKLPDAMDTAKLTGLKETSNASDYLIITSTTLQPAARALADYRQGRGLVSMVVTMAEIFDQFNYGIYDPNAITDLVSYARINWNGPPRFVVLAGDGTYDYKNILLTGDNIVPAIMTATADGLFPADNLYVDINKDGIPELPIGRLPAVTNAELQIMVNKIITYEAGSATARKFIEMVAEKPDSLGNFPADSDTVAALIPSQFTVDKIYLGPAPLLTKAQARTRIFNGINSGAWMLNYIGHGGYNLLSNSSLLKIGDEALMTNAGQYPILTAFTCLAGGFALPGYETFSEVMMQKNDGGVIATWSPTGLSVNKEAVILNQHLFEALFNEHINILGNAILRSILQYQAERNLPFVVQTYNLLGDPALELN